MFFTKTDSCDAKEISVAYGRTSATSKEVECACTCDGSDPAKQLARIENPDLGEKKKLPVTVSKIPNET